MVHGAEAFEQQQFGTAAVERVNTIYLVCPITCTPHK